MLYNWKRSASSTTTLLVKPHSRYTIYTCQKHLLTCLDSHMNLSEIPLLIQRVWYDACLPFAAKTASTLLGRLSKRFRSVFMGIFDHSSRSVFVRSHTDVGQEGLSVSALIHPKGALVHSHVGTGRGHPQTVLTDSLSVESMELSNIQSSFHWN